MRVHAPRGDSAAAGRGGKVAVMPRARRHTLALAALVSCTATNPAPDPQAVAAPAPVKPVVAKPATPPPVVEVQPAGEFDVAGKVDMGDGATPAVRNVQLPKPTVKWTAKVGLTTFRTTMALTDGFVVIGTHGKTLAGKNEASDGVYLLEPATGTETRKIVTPGSGDRDVGGVAVDKGTVYFTTDNSQIVAATLDGKIVWTAEASGKVRPAPALADLDGDGAVDVVVGDESGTLRALKGATGKPLWTVKTGENEYDARGFIAAAAIADLDGDGKDDVVAAARDGIVVAYRGTDGGVLWQQLNSSGVHASPTVADFDLDGKPEVLAAWSYGDVGVFDGKTGAVRWATVMRQDGGGIEGLFATPTPLPGKPGVLVAGTAWWNEEDSVVLVGPSARMFRAFTGRVSASPIVADLDGDGRNEAIVGTEKGVLLALNVDGGRAELAKLGGPIEAPAMLADVDADGKHELLVASNDGVLTCFSTGATGKPYLSRFRGESPHNRGDLGPTPLGWHTAPPGSTPQAPQPGVGIRVDYLRCCQDLVDEATRAAAPDNSKLLQAASKCNAHAAIGMDRAEALKSITEVAAGAPMPTSCQ
jgi:outer membrane protein assembly factor BamB